MAPKPSPSQVRFRADGPVPAAAEILASDRLSDLPATFVDPNASKGTFSAHIQLGLPVKGALTKGDTSYAVSADLNGFAADKLVMNQKLEANTSRCRQQPGLSGQGRRQDQRAGGLARLPQADRGRR